MARAVVLCGGTCELLDQLRPLKALRAVMALLVVERYDSDFHINSVVTTQKPVQFLMHCMGLGEGEMRSVGFNPIMGVRRRCHHSRKPVRFLMDSMGVGNRDLAMMEFIMDAIWDARCIC